MSTTSARRVFASRLVKQFHVGVLFLLICSISSRFLIAQEQPAKDDTAALLKLVLEQMQKKDNPIAESDRSVGIGRSAKAPEPVLDIRVYDLADLFAIAPSSQANGWQGHDAGNLLGDRNLNSVASSPQTGAGGGMGGGGMGGMGGGMFSVIDGKNVVGDYGFQPTPIKLINVIQESIPGSWDSGEETISWIGSSLVISALPETHAKIQKLLDLLQQRWNAKVTFNVHLNWIWINTEESKQLEELPLVSDAKGPSGISPPVVKEWISKLAENDDRPAQVTARMHCYNGQTFSWVSGSQKRTVANWTRGTKGTLMPEPVSLLTGVACEVTPMLAHASNNITLDIRSRYIWREKNAIDIAENKVSTMPRPDQDAIAGQTISSTVRVPVGLATVIGGGSSVDSDFDGWQLYLIASAEFSSPPQPKDATVKN